MANGAPRSVVWAEETPASKLRLIINELDEFDSNIKSLADQQLRTHEMQRKRLNWLVGLFIGLLITVNGGLILVIVGR